MEKKYILEHIDDLSADQLVDSINNGTVTLDELRKTGFLDSSKRKAITKIQNDRLIADKKEWEKVSNADLPTLINWISDHKNNIYVPDAKERIQILESARQQQIAQKQSILDDILRSPNKYRPEDVLDLLQKGAISKDDLLNCNIPQSVIDNLDEVKTPHLDIGETPESIPDGYTEVYFWGNPRAGKTCALGAVLNMANKRGLLNIAAGPGYKYANQLKNIFTDDDVANDFLPAPSPVETTQYLPFTLKKPNERKSRSVSLIELSGEIFLCFANKNAGEEFPTKSHEDTFLTLDKYLKSKNRKIHFFFIDYDSKNRADNNGMTQSDYLSAAATYFNNNKVFGDTTDAIYVILTKSDLMLDEAGNRISNGKSIEYAKKHLYGQNYLSFINSLKATCRKYSINGRKLTVETFSLGNVYFRDICNFEGKAASKIVDILMKRIPKSKNSVLDFFNQ